LPILSQGLRGFSPFALFLISLNFWACQPKPKPEWYSGNLLQHPDSIFVLQGKVIVLDPGHGGVFDGARGRSGLKEKDINLKVSLFLREMLVAKGAQVLLTRSKDTDFCNGNKRKLKLDLANRIAWANNQNPDIFISLHHNASAAGPNQENVTKTFYKMGDGGGSLDLAQSIHERFSADLKIEKNLLLPGNYKILRDCNVPAILGEPSYLSHPEMETILLDSTRLRFEAQVYFFGIVDFFKQGNCTLTLLSPDSISHQRPLIRIAAFADDPGIDPASFEFFLNGNPKKTAFLNPVFSFQPVYRLKNGMHEIKARCRHLLGNSAQELKFVFRVQNPVFSIKVRAQPTGFINGKQTRLDFKIQDQSGFANLGNRIEIKGNSGVRFINRKGTVFKDSISWALANEHPFVLVQLNRGKVLNLRMKVGEKQKKLVLKNLKTTPEIFGMVKSDKKPVPLLNIFRKEKLVGKTDETGWVYLKNPLNQQNQFLRFKKKGWVPLEILTSHLGWHSESLVLNLPLKKIEGGRLFKRKIMLDPQFGGYDFGFISRKGVRLSDLNLRLAKLIGNLLEAAGAEVFFTRKGDQSVTLQNRIENANEIMPDLFVRITQDSISGIGKIIHYPGSRGGKRLGKRLIQAFEHFHSPMVDLETGAFLILQQTPCPAVVISFGKVQKAELLEKGQRQSEMYQTAFGVFKAISGYFSKKKGPMDWVWKTGKVKPPGFYQILISDALPLVTNEKGQFSFLSQPGEDFIVVKKTNSAGFSGLINLENHKTISFKSRI